MALSRWLLAFSLFLGCSHFASGATLPPKGGIFLYLGMGLSDSYDNPSSPSLNEWGGGFTGRAGVGFGDSFLLDAWFNYFPVNRSYFSSHPGIYGGDIFNLLITADWRFPFVSPRNPLSPYLILGPGLVFYSEGSDTSRNGREQFFDVGGRLGGGLDLRLDASTALFLEWDFIGILPPLSTGDEGSGFYYMYLFHTVDAGVKLGL